jgi:hypothetical protein
VNNLFFYTLPPPWCSVSLQAQNQQSQETVDWTLWNHDLNQIVSPLICSLRYFCHSYTKVTNTASLTFNNFLRNRWIFTISPTNQYYYSIWKFRMASKILQKEENPAILGRVHPSLGCQLDTFRTESLSA